MDRGKAVIVVTLIAVFGVVGTAVYAQLPPPVAARGPRGMTPGMDVQFMTKVVKGAPFSAQGVTEIHQTLSDGNQINRTATSSLYRDSEGRTRREETLAIMGPWQQGQLGAQPLILINDPVAGTHFVLNPATRIAHRAGQPHARFEDNAAPPPPGNANMPPPPGGPEPRGRDFEERLAEEGGTVNKESLGTQMVQGVQAEGTRTTVTIPEGSIGNLKPIQIVTERWYSPALQVVVMSKRSDPRFGETTYRLSNINQAEPSADLFRVPFDYTTQDAPAPSRMRERK